MTEPPLDLCAPCAVCGKRVGAGSLSAATHDLHVTQLDVEFVRRHHEPPQTATTDKNLVGNRRQLGDDTPS